jgi:hypothetical protein
VAWLMAFALVVSQMSLALAAPVEALPAGTSRQMLPCHAGAGMQDEAAMDEGGGSSPAKPLPACPMMQGALCLSICAAVTPSATSIPLPEPAVAVQLWLRDAAALPHVVPPLQRPPKSV